jgi:hypothetical protein
MQVPGLHPQACYFHLEGRFLSTRSAPQPCLASSPPTALSRYSYQFLCLTCTVPHKANTAFKGSRSHTEFRLVYHDTLHTGISSPHFMTSSPTRKP